MVCPPARLGESVKRNLVLRGLAPISAGVCLSDQPFEPDPLLIIRVRARSGRLRPVFTVEKGALPGEGSAGLFVTGLSLRLTHADSLREYDVIHEGRLFLAGWDGLRAVMVTSEVDPIV
jgi:hypothetical protein